MTPDPTAWRSGNEEVEVLFVGRGRGDSRRERLRLAAGRRLPVAWLEQRHTAICLEARAGSCGEGDALWTTEPDLALCVATADCVPVALAAAGRVAVVHAGWRGIVGGIVGRAAEAILANGEDHAAAAWIGPAIGVCCYEVGDEVAGRVEAATAAGVVAPGTAGRPHLDLVAAVEGQLRSAGIVEIERLGPCTKCSPELLFSYRREGAGAGRNLAFAWLRAAPGAARHGRRGRVKGRVGRLD